MARPSAASSSSNMVNASTKAYVDNVPASGKLINAAGRLSVTADDKAVVDADINLKAQSSSSNDGGLSVALDLIKSQVNDYEFTTKSGTQTVKKGDYAWRTIMCTPTAKAKSTSTSRLT